MSQTKPKLAPRNADTGPCLGSFAPQQAESTQTREIVQDDIIVDSSLVLLIGGRSCRTHFSLFYNDTIQVISRKAHNYLKSVLCVNLGMILKVPDGPVCLMQPREHEATKPNKSCTYHYSECALAHIFHQNYTATEVW